MSSTRWPTTSVAAEFSSDVEAAANEPCYGGFLDFQYTYQQGLTHGLGFEYFDEQLNINDLGFLQRNDHYRVRSSLIQKNPTLTGHNIIGSTDATSCKRT